MRHSGYKVRNSVGTLIGSYVERWEADENCPAGGTVKYEPKHSQRPPPKTTPKPHVEKAWVLPSSALTAPAPDHRCGSEAGMCKACWEYWLWNVVDNLLKSHGKFAKG